MPLNLSKIICIDNTAIAELAPVYNKKIYPNYRVRRSGEQFNPAVKTLDRR